MSSLIEKLTTDSLVQISGLLTQEIPTSALYVVGLPIGNLGDITLRALWILSKVDAIAAEDTRETKKLLEKYGIDTKLLSVREHNEHSGAEQIINFLSQGCRVALVTDAGTPAVSDPGAKAVKLIQQAGYRIVPIPGASAVVTALSASGVESIGFSFVGFLPPQSKARVETLKRWLSHTEAFVLYEAPHRLDKLLADLVTYIEPDREVVIARELTKKFEELVYLKGSTLQEWANNQTPKGEYAIIVGPRQEEKHSELTDEQKRWLEQLVELVPASKLAAVAAKVTGIDRSSIYQFLMDSKEPV